MKKCKKCEETKPINEYTFMRTSKDRLAPYCKKCDSIRATNNRKRLVARETIEFPDSKKCFQCHEIKPSNEFDYDRGVLDGLSRRCKNCRSSADKSRYETEMSTDARKKKLKIMLGSARKRAKKLQVPFDLSEDFMMKKFYNIDKCAILEVSIDWEGRGMLSPTSPSLDRIIPSNGYTKDNVRVISHKANTMKSDATPEELHKFASFILSTIVQNA